MTGDFEREAYHLLQYFAVVRNDNLAGRHELRSFLVLDSIRGLDYTFYVVRSIDSKLKGSESRATRESIFLYPNVT